MNVDWVDGRPPPPPEPPEVRACIIEALKPWSPERLREHRETTDATLDRMNNHRRRETR